MYLFGVNSNAKSFLVKESYSHAGMPLYSMSLYGPLDSKSLYQELQGMHKAIKSA